MKKLLSLILAMAMLLCAVPALADTTLGDPFAFELDLFRIYFDTFYTSTVQNATATWTEGEGTVTISGESLMDIVLYLDENGNITYMSCPFTGSSEELGYATGVSLGVSSSLMSMAAMLAETGDVDKLQELAATIEDDYNIVFDCMLNTSDFTTEQLIEGVSSSGTLMGYPANLAYHVDATDMSNPIFYLEFILAPMGTTF